MQKLSLKEPKIRVHLENRGTLAPPANKFMLETAADGERILPAYLSDNYVSLLPGEAREIEVEYPASAAKGLPGLKSGDGTGHDRNPGRRSLILLGERMTLPDATE